MPEVSTTSTQFSVAVHVLTLLAAGRELQALRTSPELASSVGTNPAHVRRVLGSLRRAGLVTSTPGAAGGSTLALDPGDITLRDVWQAVAGDGQVLGVHTASVDCVNGQAIQTALQQIERAAADALASELQRTTIADVLAETPAGRQLSARPHGRAPAQAPG